MALHIAGGILIAAAILAAVCVGWVITERGRKLDDDVITFFGLGLLASAMLATALCIN